MTTGTTCYHIKIILGSVAAVDGPFERNHDVFLGILAQPFPSIYTRGSQSAGRIEQPCVCLREIRFGHRCQDTVALPWLILATYRANRRPTQVAQITFNIRLCAAHIVRSTPLLQPDRDVGDEYSVAIDIRRLERPAPWPRADFIVFYHFARIMTISRHAAITGYHLYWDLLI